MDILFYRYNSIYEPDCISVFKNFGINVVEETAEMHDKTMTGGQAALKVADRIAKQNAKGSPFLFVFSINFYPAISGVCEKLGVIYACWTVDCPIPELFSTQIRNSHNRVFLFDLAQYERIKPYNPDCIFYLPLASNVERLDKVIDTIGRSDIKKYSSDISFVGSLYSEKNPVNKMKLEPYMKGYIDGLAVAQMKLYGVNFLESAMSQEAVEKLKGQKLEKNYEGLVEPIDSFCAAHSIMGYHIAEIERRTTLNMLAENFSVDLYTLSDTKSLVNVNLKGQAHTLTEMPKIFHLSKINLNMTMRSIQTGLPLRIFDILGSGGFVMTNYQQEIPEMFEVGKDLEVYTSLEELQEKCAYYLEHDEERIKIALNGYNKTKKYHDINIRMKNMLECMLR